MSDRNVAAVSVQLIRENRVLKNVYLWMTAGLALTGVVSLGVINNPPILSAIAGNPILFFGLIIAEVGLVMLLSARINRMSPQAATLAFTAYAILNGATLSLVLLRYTGQTVATAFFVTAGTFAASSIFGLTTRSSLAGAGSYLRMGVIGLIIAMVVNMFLGSGPLDYLISIAGVAIFVALTAYDTQMIKQMSEQLGDEVSDADFVRLSIIGALKLYLDFINLLILILRLFGSRD